MSQGFTKGTPIDTDPTLSLDSDIVVPSQKAVKDYVDTGLASKVPSTRNITINGTTQDLSTDRTWTVLPTPGNYTATLAADTNDLNAGITGDGMLTLTPTTNVKLTGLQGGANGRTITIFNGSSNYFVFLECNTGSSSVGNRLFNPSGSYIIMAPLEMQRFTYNSVNNRWISEPLDLSRQFDMFDDFEGFHAVTAITTWGFSLGPWSFRVSGTSGASAGAYLSGVSKYTRRGTVLARIGQGVASYMGFQANGTSASGGNLRNDGGAGSYRMTAGSITSLVDMNTIASVLAVGFSQSATPNPATAGLFWRYGPTDSIGGGGTGTWKCHINGSITIDSAIPGFSDKILLYSFVPIILGLSLNRAPYRSYLNEEIIISASFLRNKPFSELDMIKKVNVDNS
jgi:hypothetical protein